MSENIKPERSFDKLGLPPMELAESSENGRRSNETNKRLFSLLQKLIMMVLLMLLGAGMYILVIRFLEYADSSRTTEIILIRGIQENPNITDRDDDIEIFLRLGNKTKLPLKTRRKRHAIIPSNSVTDTKTLALKEDKLQKARDIIMKHDFLCKHNNKEGICKDLIMKLKSIADSSKHNTNENNSFIENLLKHDSTPETIHKSILVKDIGVETIKKRETSHSDKLQSILESVPHTDVRDGYAYGYNNPGSMMPHPSPGSSAQLTDTCLLARLLKQNYPHVHGIYDIPTSEYMVPHYEQPALSHDRYYPHSPSPPYIQGRDVDARKSKLHPQDVDIFMSLLTPKPEISSNSQSKNSSTRDAECPIGSMPCDSRDSCVSEKQWCDGNVDCPDVSDEASCACKSRVDKSRLCDGYFDCPFGEDEMGCYGCTENTFSCEDLDINSQSTCFAKEQRCDDVPNCPNYKDEIECNMLAPSLIKKPLFAISNTEGFLHRNFKGDWYPVCKNPYMWAHDACRRETGLIIRPPFIQIVAIDPLLKVNYLNTGPGGMLQESDTCFNSSAVYITCPDLLCGTRVLTTTQLLKENAAIESRLFGRNKRFLYAARPYPLMFYRNRLKRHTDSNIVKNGTSYLDFEPEEKFINPNTIRNIIDQRNKRSDIRVVGGKPSKPAAWPWMVAIYRNGMFHCGGVIVTQNWVISAAHCVNKFWDHHYEIQVGMLRRFSFSPQEQNHRVTHIIVNQHYRQEDMKNDLSLLRVEPVIQLSRWVRPICLPGPDTAGPDWLTGPTPGTVCTAVGWGATVESGPDPDHMREVEVPIWDKCKHREDRAGREICAGPVEGGKDACQGDSGGPLLCRNPLNSQQWYVAGIVSHGDGCARKDEPGVYTRVSLFVKWIRYHISSKSLPIVKPIQECPGFKCKSGISKCIPNKRKCDKIVDCLDGEDEVDCDFMKSANSFDGSMFLTEMLKSNENNNLKEDNRIAKEANTESALTTRNIEYFETTETSSHLARETTMEAFTSTNNLTTAEGMTETSQDGDNITDKSVTLIKNTEPLDFTHASTLEISLSDSSEESQSDSREHVTTGPPTSVTFIESDEVGRADMQTIAMSLSRDTLEPRSAVKNQKYNENETTRDVDVQEDWSSIDSTTQQTINLTDLTEIENTGQSEKQETVTPISLQDNVELSDHENIVNDSKAELNINSLSEKTQDKNKDSESEKLVIELLPTTQTTPFHLTNEEFNNKTDELKNNSETSASNNDELFSSKNISGFEDKQDIIHKIEDIVFSELQPAKIRRKHRIPKEFECGRILQVIPYHLRCDHKADCEDGTDELGCTCEDYLSTLDEKLLCDGILDCADGQDEIDCFNCPEEHFLCKRSQMCLPIKHVCDGKSHCPQGEDELDCYALSNGKELLYDIDGRPNLKLEGYVTKRHEDEWHIVCEDNLSNEQIEQEATHVCHNLEFSSANRYFIKYVNVMTEDILKANSDDKRKKRDTNSGTIVHFTYRNTNDTAKHIVIKEPQVLQEQCIPNITKTCKSLYVLCDQSLFTNFDNSQKNVYTRGSEINPNYTWPWIAKVYVEGDYKCTGILVDVSWVLVSQSCLWDTSTHNFMSVILGSHRTLSSTNGPYEQIYQIDGKKDLYRSKVALLHLKQQAQYTNMVKPMIVTVSNNHLEKKNNCVAIGQDKKNTTISVFLEETNENCTIHNSCFKRKGNETICHHELASHREWAGIVSCHTEQGWYPAASFVDSRGECGFSNHVLATDIENLKNEIKFYSGKKTFTDSMEQSYVDDCEGIRCSRGRCIDLAQTCDGVRQCEDGNDESEEACSKKHAICEHGPYHRGCVCSSGQMKCRNGRCISKELFRDGRDDCGDATDEPGHTTCSNYLARVMPSRLCDGVLHCHDRSDEDPTFCKCYAKRTYQCGKRISNIDQCVAPDMVCDGIRDCPNGEDEQTCIGLNAPEGTPYGTGQVIVRSHGVWHAKCYHTQEHTKSELEDICWELGFISGHAKEIKGMHVVHPHNNLIVDPFTEVVLNNNTIIKMRNTHEPIARAVFDIDLPSCYPVFIECL